MTNRPTIGVALSGGSSRAIAHVGVLEVLTEHNIPIDYLVGCSSGAFAAVSYAGGTLQDFKQWMESSTLQEVFRLWSFNNAWRGGIFHVHNADDVLNKFINGITFETANPKLGFVAADLNTGELVTLGQGDLLTAIKASFAVPALFEPVVWGNKLLVDGGLLSIVPTKPVKDLGADIVIGVNVSGARFIYEKKLPLWRKFRTFTKILGWEFLRRQQIKLSNKFFSMFNYNPEGSAENIKTPTILGILSQAMDLSMKISDNWKDSDIECDVMITPSVKQYRKTEMSNLDEIYREGRRAAMEAIPKIKAAVEQYNKNEVRSPKFKAQEQI